MITLPEAESARQAILSNDRKRKNVVPFKMSNTNTCTAQYGHTHTICDFNQFYELLNKF